jgi:hypothetical protein
MTDVFLAAMDLLAQDTPRNTGPDFGKAAPLGLLIVVVLLVGTFALVWSMNRHLRRLPKTFRDADAEDAGTDASGTNTRGEPDG